MSLPIFRYHPDPIGSGSFEVSAKKCKRCGKSRGYIYNASVYSQIDLDDALCPWCIADGSAHKKFKATFVDAEAFPDGTPSAAIAEITQRTPGFASWQSEKWPACCNDATAFVAPVGIKEIRGQFREQEYSVLSHIIYEMQISGGAATRLLGSLNRDAGPTAYIFHCLHCERHHFHIDYL